MLYNFTEKFTNQNIAFARPNCINVWVKSYGSHNTNLAKESRDKPNDVVKGVNMQLSGRQQDGFRAVSPSPGPPLRAFLVLCPPW